MVAATICPTSTEELAEVVGSAQKVSIEGLGRHSEWRCDSQEGLKISTANLSRILDLEPENQVVQMEAGIAMSQLQLALKDHGQTIPWAPYETGDDPSVGGALSLALPHLLEGGYGSWRDWILGMTIVRGDGAVARCGSRAVKNVAGYEISRFMVGTRGAFGVIASVILRTYPLALIEPIASPIPSQKSPAKRWVQRVKFSDKDQLSPAIGYCHAETATLWAVEPPESGMARANGDWLIKSGFGPANLDPLDGANLKAYLSAKAHLDPKGQFNEGAFPIADEEK